MKPQYSLSHVAARIGALFALCMLAIALSGCSALEQMLLPTGTVTGYVADDSGNRLRNAWVTAGDRSTSTKSDGTFTLEFVPIGAHTVKASLLGYADLGEGSKPVIVLEIDAVDIGRLKLAPAPDGEVFMWRLPYSASDFTSHGSGHIDGTAYADSLLGNVSAGSSRQAIYLLNKRFERFKATVGVSDDASDGQSQLIFRVLGDGNLLHETSALKRGQQAIINVDTSGVNSLQLLVEHQLGTGNGVDFVWGNARVTVKY